VDSVLDLPFIERPVDELLHFDPDRREVDRQYAGFGWTRLPRVWLGTTRGTALEPVDDALVLALHSADAGAALADDIELEFELAREVVQVSATLFLTRWLPRLPQTRSIVLAMCNPHRARLALPVSRPLWYPLGDAESWIDDANGGRIELLAEDSWARVTA
jgi:hypothetical protein